MARSKKPLLTLMRKRAIAGYFFTLPFIIGFTLFFAVPMIQSIVFSLSELEITYQGFNLRFVGLDNYRHALFVDPQFTRVLVETIFHILINIPSMLIFGFLQPTC